jgi:hypothetical protein
VFADPAYEPLVNLDLGQRQLTQVSPGREAGPEVVDGQAESGVGQPGGCPSDRSHGGDELALGVVEGELPTPDAGPANLIQQAVDEGVVMQISHAHVY